MKKPKIGEKAPDFKGETEEGKVIGLKDFEGKKLVLFFYSRDNTPTCTIEACNLRDNHALLKKNGYEIVGVSADTKKKHQNFKNKYELPFPLIADTERKVIEKFGVWGEKKFMGKVYDGIYRTTFVIDEQGKIEDVFEKVNSKDHANQILNNN